MSALFNQTNISPGTTNFVTQQEVSQGLDLLFEGISTIIGDLSGASFDLNQPNLRVSTIAVNPTGTISGAANITGNKLQLSSVGALAVATPVLNPTLKFAAITNAGGQLMADLYGKNFNAQNSLVNQNQNQITYGYTGVYGLFSNGGSDPLATWLPQAGIASNGWALTGVSTINGNQIGTAFNSYTTLNGTNINNTGVINTPSVVGVSSLNGAVYPPTALNPVSVNASQMFTSSLNAAGGVNINTLTTTKIPTFSNCSPLVWGTAPYQPVYFLGGQDVMNGTSEARLQLSSINGSIITANACGVDVVVPLVCQPIGSQLWSIYADQSLIGQKVNWQLWSA